MVYITTSMNKNRTLVIESFICDLDSAEKVIYTAYISTSVSKRISNIFIGYKEETFNYAATLIETTEIDNTLTLGTKFNEDVSAITDNQGEHKAITAMLLNHIIKFGRNQQTYILHHNK